MGAEGSEDQANAPASSAGIAALGSFKAGGNHGTGFCTAAWCQIEDEGGSRLAWHAITAGQDGKLVLRKGNESLSIVKISGDHEKAAHCVAVSGDGKTVASVEDKYVQVRCWMERLYMLVLFTGWWLRPKHCKQHAQYAGQGCGASVPVSVCCSLRAVSKTRSKLLLLLTLTHDVPAPLPTTQYQLYCTPDLDLISSACRFTLPGRSVVFGGKSGSMLAAAGDDGLIKLVNVGDDNKVCFACCGLCCVPCPVLCCVLWCVVLCTTTERARMGVHASSDAFAAAAPSAMCLIQTHATTTTTATTTIDIPPSECQRIRALRGAGPRWQLRGSYPGRRRLGGVGHRQRSARDPQAPEHQGVWLVISA